MDSSQILTITVFVIVITIVGTIALAVVGYLAFRIRDRKHPSGPELERPPGTPYFFERIGLPQAGDDTTDRTDGDTAVKALPGGEPAEGGDVPDDKQPDDPAPAAEDERTAEEGTAPTGSDDPEKVDPEDGSPRD